MSQGRGREDRQVGGGEGRTPQEEGERETEGIPRVTRLRLLPHRAGSPPLLAQMSAAGAWLFLDLGAGPEAGTAPHRLWALCAQEALGF